MDVIDINSTQMGRSLVQIMAKGTIAFCSKYGIPIPGTYEEFESGVVQKSRELRLEGSIAFQDDEAGNEAVRLFSDPLGISPELIDLPLDELNQKIRESAELQKKFSLLRMLLSGRIQDKGEIFSGLGEEFAPIADAFSKKYCYRRAVFDAMQEMIRVSS